MRFLHPIALVIAALVMPGVVQAQARAGDAATTAASPFTAAFQRFDEALVPSLLGADDAAGRWTAGRLSSFDPAGQARDYAAAVAREPKEMLYVASLAEACMGPPTLAECSERDAVGYWVSRDSDNAVPWLLQAERARRRNNLAAAIDNLDRASRAGRYDSYERRAGAVLAKRVAPLAGPADRAAVALYAANTTGGVVHLQALEAMCSPAVRGQDPRIGSACVRLGALMAERATLLSDRRAGTQIGLASAPAAARADIGERARAVVALQDRCRESQAVLERLAAGSAAERERAVRLGNAWLDDRARDGEAAACDALTRSLGQK